MVIDIGGPRSRIEQLRQLIADSKANGDRVPDVIFVDAKPRLSASKFRNEAAA